MTVHCVLSRCGVYREDTAYENLDDVDNAHGTRTSHWGYVADGCVLGRDVACTVHEPGPAKCCLNVRISSAFTLMACLVIKAIYMCAVNLLARG